MTTDAARQKWRILAALGLAPTVLVGCTDRAIIDGEGIGGSSGDVWVDTDDPVTPIGTTTPDASTTGPVGTSTSGPATSTTGPVGTSTSGPVTTSTSGNATDPVPPPPPLCMSSGEWLEVEFCMPKSLWAECVCDEICQQKAIEVWYDEKCCDGCDYVFGETLCAEDYGDQCCYVGLLAAEWCGEGRPFVVEDEARTAPVVDRDDWATLARGPDVRGLDDRTRHAFRRRWLAIASAEHASVASFARFVLELTAVGAPPDLLRDASRAMADEVRHAAVAFAFASAYAGPAAGPGPLDMTGVDARSDLDTIVRAVVREGCVGETMSAAEVDEAARRASDPAIATALAEIAGDENRHAALAWRFVQWALRAAPSLGTAVRDEFTRACQSAGRPPVPADPDPLPPAVAEAHGLLDARTRTSVRQRCLRETIGPCAEALLWSWRARPEPAVA